MRWWSALSLAAVAIALSAPAWIGCRPTPSNKPTAPSAEAKPTLSPDALRRRIDKVLDQTLRAPLDVKTTGAWQVVHGCLAFGRQFQVVSREGQTVGGLEYLLSGNELEGWKLRAGDKGVVAVQEPGSKTGMGHPDQWLGYLSQVGMSRDEKLIVGGTTFTVGDLITQAQWDIREGMEATWTLMALASYLPPDAAWKAKDGSEWTIQRIVNMETGQDLGASFCGGSHRLYGLTVARNRRRDSGQPLTEVWKAAEAKIAAAAAKARQFQQPDGSFSTNWFERAATSPDIELRINRTGHVLEFLSVALSDAELQEEWVTRGATALVTMLEKTQEFRLECGSLYHAAHGLKLYRERRFGPLELPLPGSAPSSAPQARGGQQAKT